MGKLIDAYTAALEAQVLRDWGTWREYDWSLWGTSKEDVPALARDTVARMTNASHPAATKIARRVGRKFGLKTSAEVWAALREEAQEGL